VFDSLTFKQNFLPAGFSPPLLTTGLTNNFEINANNFLDFKPSNNPKLLSSNHMSSNRIVVFHGDSVNPLFRRFGEDFRKAFDQSFPDKFPIELPFRRLSILGFHFRRVSENAALIPSDENHLFPNFVLDQSYLEVVLVVDLASIPLGASISNAADVELHQLSSLENEVFNRYYHINFDSTKIIIPTRGLSLMFPL